MTLTFGSLFAGIGGLDLGLERAGFRCVWQVEIDDYANQVLAKHWPDVRRWKDVRSFPPDSDIRPSEQRPKVEIQAGRELTELPSSRDWRCDLIAAGFPCQDISYAGKGAGIRGERSGLFFETARVVGLLRPRFVLLENVAALLNRGMVEVLGTLASLGYDTEWHCLQAADFGAPHIRDRVFIVGEMGDAEHDGSPDVHSHTGSVEVKQSQVCKVRQPSGTSPPCERAGAKPFTFARTWPGRSGNERAEWATEPGIRRVANGIPARVDRLRGLGNAVVPQVAEFVGRMIMEAANGSD